MKILIMNLVALLLGYYFNFPVRIEYREYFKRDINQRYLILDHSSDGNQIPLPVKICCVASTPHYVSGEIPGFDKNEKFTANYNLGALVKIFIRNTSSSDTIDPEVKFNGKTGSGLLADGVISYGNTPDIRISETSLTSKLPPLSYDFYLLNITDSNFYSGGIRIKITDKTTGRELSETIIVRKPELLIERILFTSSEGTKNPDGFYIYLMNNSVKTISVTGISILKAGNNFTQHWWNERDQLQGIEWFGRNGIIKPGELNGAYVKTGKLDFGEIIVEIEYKSGSAAAKTLFNIKPLIISFDCGMGWAEKDLAGSEAFCKTMSLLHLNTVNGNATAFFADSNKARKYEILKFAKLQDVDVNNKPGNLARIHAAEHFGEPQFSKIPAREIYSYYTSYRHSGYPTTLTLSHEPGFNRFAGVVDFPHFDAYRVTAPHADRWGEYYKYNEKNVRWGAPLETIGFYMRTLHRISAPNPVAAWTQGMSNDWSSRLRPGAGNPNDLEMRIQAFEAVANGALSLYWFNMSGKNIIKSRGSLREIRNINRELKTAGELIARSVPFSWINRFMDSDLNLLAGRNYAVLFAADLKYGVSQDNQFVSSGTRYMTMAFTIPSYLSGCRDVVKITHEGLVRFNAYSYKGSVTFTDSVNSTGMYVLYNSDKINMFEYLDSRFKEIKEKEIALEFNPVDNDRDFEKLVTEIQNLYKMK